MAKNEKELVYRCWEADVFSLRHFVLKIISGYEAGNGTEVGGKLD